MTIENKSEFLPHQEDVCEKTKPKEKEPDKICPTCKPDENALVPDWWTMDKPFLNKKTCEYSIGVTINQNGDTYTIGELDETLESNAFEAIKKTYVRPGIRMLLRYYSKLESDEVVCGLPPENPGEECGDVIDINFRDYIEEFHRPIAISDTKMTVTSVESPGKTTPVVGGRAVNMDALEVYARTPEFRFTSMNRDGGLLQVLVTVPAFIFDKVPEAPELPEVDTDVERLSMKADEFYLYVNETIAAFRVFSNYQSYFYETQNGQLYFSDTNSKFYLGLVTNRMRDFLSGIEALIENNGMSFGKGASFLPKAHEIEILFDKEDANVPFTIKRIRAKEKNCNWKRMKKGFSSIMKRGAFKDQTTIGYIANIEEIHPRVTAKETPPWLDFVIEFTFPALKVDFGSANKFPGLDTCLQDTNAISDMILKTTLSFSDSFAYQLNKANCLTMYGKEYIFKNFPSDLDESAFDDDLEKKGLKGKIREFTKNYGFDAEDFENHESGKAEYLKMYIRKKYNQQKRKIKNSSPLLEAMEDFKLAFKRDNNYFGPLGTLVDMFNPCSFKEFMLTLLKCLFRGMTADTAYLTVIKGTLGNLAANGLEIVIQALPADKQQEIRDKVEAEFAGMPAPWDDAWESGSLSKPRQAQTLQEVEQRLNDRKGVTPLKKKMKDALSKIQKYGFTGKIEIGFGSSNLNMNYVLIYVPPTNDSVEVFWDPSESAGTDSAGAVEEEAQRLRAAQQLGWMERSGNDLPPPPETTSGEEMIENVKILVDGADSIMAEYLYDIGSFIDMDLSKYAAEQRDEDIDALLKEHSDICEKLDKIETELEYKKANYQALISPAADVIELEKQIDDLESERSDLEVMLEKNEEERISWNDPDSKKNKKLFKDMKKECKKLLKQLRDLNNESLTLTKTIQETNDMADWDSLSDEEKAEITEKIREEQVFIDTNPDSEMQTGTLGRGIGNTQQIITKAYVDAIINTAEIQEIMRAIDNVPGMKLMGRYIATFNCPNTHFIYPSIGGFMSTLTFDPCGPEPTTMSLPSLNDIPKLSWDFIGNLVKSFIKALKVTLKEALAALLAKSAQMLDAVICELLGGKIPETLSLMEILGRDGCKESDILNAALNPPPGRPPLPDEEYSNLAKQLSNAGDGTQMQNALLGNCDPAYASTIVSVVETRAPAFADALSTAEDVCEFFAMAGGLLTPEQRSNMEDSLDASSFFNLPTNACLTNIELEQMNEDMDAILPEKIKSEYNDQETDRLTDNADQVINMVLNGPNSVLQDVVDAALEGDPDCVDEVNTVAAVMRKAKEAPSFKKVREGIFNRIQSAFLDDMIQWNLLEVTDPPGILGQILSDKKGYTLNRYNWYMNLKNSNPVFAFLFPEPSPLPETVGLHLREKFLNTTKVWNPSQDSANINLEYDTADVDSDHPWRSAIEFYNDIELSSLTSEVIAKSDEIGQIKIKISEPASADVEEFIIKLSDQTDPGKNYRSELMRQFIKGVWSDFDNLNITEQTSKSVIRGINNIMIKKLSKSLFYDSRGQLPQGFLYGYEPLEITADDLTYVNPEPGSTEYTYEEESAVLGRSLTNNPRVKFLDPSEHGGTYTSPFYDILGEEKQGWSQFAKAIVSSMPGCDDADSNFMFFNDIMDTLEKDEGRIPADERLQLAPDCVNELPFDKLASPSTLATLGGIVTAIIRVHVIDYMVRTFSINSNVQLSFERNHSKSSSKFIASVMNKSLSSQSSIWTSTYERDVYWFLFLEQAVQSVKRKMDSDEIKPDSRLKALMETINEAQKKHKTPTVSDLRGFANVTEWSLSSEGAIEGWAGLVATGALLISGGAGALTVALAAGVFKIAFGKFSLNQARLAAKIGTIHSVEKECVEVLTYLIEEQMDFYSDVISQVVEPRPYVYDISKFFIGASNTMVKGDIKAGDVEIEQPTGGETNFVYGEIDNCVPNVSLSPLKNVPLSPEQIIEIKNNGGLFLEKYLRIEDKITTEGGESFDDSLEWIYNRDESLKGVVNINSFKEFLNNNHDKIPVNANISDFFGNATTRIIDEGYNGSIGIKFGVRLCYIPPEDFGNTIVPTDTQQTSQEVNWDAVEGDAVYGLAPSGLGDQMANEMNVVRGRGNQIVSYLSDSSPMDNATLAIREKSYILTPHPELPMSKNIFPLCSFESDVLDRKLRSYLDSNNNFDQDLKCYVDGLTQTTEFKFLFNQIFNIKKIPSLVSLYCYNNFYASLGKGRDEREDSDDANKSDFSKIFNDTKNELRKMFVSNYKRKDFDPPNEEDEEGGFMENITRDILSKTVNNIFVAGTVPWWVKWRYKPQTKVDENGDPCGNAFGGLVNLTTGSE